MSKSLSEIRKSPHVGRAERTLPLCLAANLSEKVHEYDEELGALLAQREQLEKRLDLERDRDQKRPGAVGRKTDATRLVEQIEAIDEKAEALAETADAARDEMAEHMIDVRLRTKENGDWRRWCEAHPAREDEPRDRLYGVAVCNADELIESIGDYVVKIGPDAPAEGDWAFCASVASPGDLLRFARTLMGMHETAIDLPKSRTAWLRDHRSALDSE